MCHWITLLLHFERLYESTWESHFCFSAASSVCTLCYASTSEIATCHGSTPLCGFAKVLLKFALGQVVQLLETNTSLSRGYKFRWWFPAVPCLFWVSPFSPCNLATKAAVSLISSDFHVKEMICLLNEQRQEPSAEFCLRSDVTGRLLKTPPK